MQICPQLINSALINRLLVKPIPQQVESIKTESKDIVIPSLSNISKTGRVVSVCADSEYSIGDVLQYLYPKGNESDYEILHEDEVFEFIEEREVITQNGEPISVVFVEPMSKAEVSEHGIVVNNALGTTQKGKIVAAPKNSKLQVRKTIEYRRDKEVVNLYPKIPYNGIMCDVLQFRDIFKYSGKVYGGRIIVKIDLKKQHKRQSSDDHGISVPPRFRYMKHCLQVGEVVEMGVKASKFYPSLKVGDIAILHHFVESVPHKLLSRDDEFEYRILDEPADNYKEIMGVIKKHPINGEYITLFDNQLAVSQEVMPFEETYNDKMSAHEELGGKSIAYVHYVEMVEQRRGRYDKEYEHSLNVFKYEGRTLKLDTPEGVAKMHDLDRQIAELQGKKWMIDQFIQRDFLVVCQPLFPKQEYKIAVPFKKLYPLHIMGKDYLIVRNAELVVMQIKD